MPLSHASPVSVAGTFHRVPGIDSQRMAAAAMTSRVIAPGDTRSAGFFTASVVGNTEVTRRDPSRAIGRLSFDSPCQPRPLHHAAPYLAVCLVVSAAFTMTMPAHAAPGFSGLDNHTLETLKRSDQRPKHQSLRPTQRGDDRGRREAPRLSSSQAARIAREREGGKVLNVILEHGPSGPYYRVKILEQGRVQVVHIDAR